MWGLWGKTNSKCVFFFTFFFFVISMALLGSYSLQQKRGLCVKKHHEVELKGCYSAKHDSKLPLVTQCFSPISREMVRKPLLTKPLGKKWEDRRFERKKY